MPDLSHTDNLQPPDKEEVERELDDLFKYGDIKQTARYSRIPYGTLSKQVNANDVTESCVYEFLMLVYGAEMAKLGLGDAVWSLAAKHRVRRRPERPATINGIDDEYHRWRAAFADFREGKLTAVEWQAAKDRYAEFIGGVGLPDRMGEPITT